MHTLDLGRAVRDGRPADLLLRLGWGSCGHGHAGSLLTEALPLLADREGSLYPPLALVFGSAGSVEALELLRRGWTVVAYDQVSTETPSTARLTLDTANVGEAVLPHADLIYTGAGLPFRTPEAFAIVWGRIVRALRPGGWFVGHLLGDRDSLGDDPEVTVLNREQVVRLLGGFRIETLREQTEDNPPTVSPRRWHTFQLIARRR